MRKGTIAATLVWALLFSSVAGTSFVDLAGANGYIPSPNTQIAVVSLQNSTCNNNTVTVTFFVSQAFRWLNFYHSLDGQEMKTVNNVTKTMEYNLNAGKNPSVMVADLRGCFVLGNLSEGWHNVTILQIGNSPSGNPEDGEIMNSASTQFRVDTTPEPEPFPTIPVVAATASAVVAGAGFLFYFKKRKG